MNTTRWSELSEPAEVAEAIVEFYRDRGQGHYDEVVSQVQHALQCGSIALASGADDATIVAAFLHDIGHLLMPDRIDPGTSDADHHHEHVGARFLSRWFDDDVVEPIRLHVPGKRYLCAVEPEYIAGLSPASLRSLRLQGGPMTAAEVQEFERNPRHGAAVALRRWDDLAKDPSAPTPELDTFGQIIEEVLCEP